MNEDEELTSVIFRKTKRWGVEAFFPDEPASPGMMLNYAHLGQHSEASLGYYHTTDPADPEEYADLKAELERIGYKLLVRQRRPSWRHSRA